MNRRNALLAGAIGIVIGVAGVFAWRQFVGVREPSRLARAGFHFMSATFEPLPSCPGGIQVAKVVRVKIPKNLEMHLATRDVRQKSKIAGTDEDADDDKPTIPGDAPNGYSPDPNDLFSIDLAQQNSPGKYAEIRIILNDPKYAFYTNSNAEVAIWDGDYPSLLQPCGVDISQKGAHKTAIFYVKMKAPTGHAVTGHFNIGIVETSHQRTPIFIDPEVHNEG